MDESKLFENKTNKIELNNIYDVVDDYNSIITTEYLNDWGGLHEKNTIASLSLKETEMRNLLGVFEVKLKEIGLISEKRSDESHSSSKIVLTLQDGRKFLAYINDLSVKDLGLDNQVAIKKFIEITIDSLLHRYKFGNGTDTDAILELREFFREILDSIKEKIELNDKEKEIFEKGYSFVGPLQGGYFKEHIKLLNLGVFNKSWGPEKWMYDITPEKFTEKWGKIILILSEIKKNPKGKEYFDKTVKYLIDATSNSILIMKQELLEDEKVKKYFEPILPIAENMHKELNGLL